MFRGRDRVEEDLRRIREANLPHEKERAEEAQRQLQRARERAGRAGPKDVVAMIIAIFSLILPYVIFFVCAMGLTLGLLVWWIH